MSLLSHSCPIVLHGPQLWVPGLQVTAPIYISLLSAQPSCVGATASQAHRIFTCLPAAFGHLLVFLLWFWIPCHLFPMFLLMLHVTGNNLLYSGPQNFKVCSIRQCLKMRKEVWELLNIKFSNPRLGPGIEAH